MTETRPGRRRDRRRAAGRTPTRAARGSCRSGSRRRASSPSPTSRSPATCWTPTPTARSRCCGRCCSSSSRSSTARSSSCCRARSPTAARAAITAGTRCGSRCSCRRASRPPSSSSPSRCKGPIEDAFDSTTLYWIFVGATLAYAASYFARGYLAGHQWFALYGGLVLFESVSRFCFPVAVAVGLAQRAVGRRAGHPRGARWPRCSSCRGRSSATPPPTPRRSPTSARSRCARARASPLSVAAIQLAEQALLNASVLTVSATATTALAGVVFNALLITRAPLQLFQSIQTSLLPHLSGLEATEGHEAFARAIRVTAPGHRRLRRRGGARAAAHRAVGDGRRLRPRLSTTGASGWPSSPSAWASTSARGRSTRPRWPAATARAAATMWLAARRRLRRVDGRAARRRRARAHRGRLRGRGGAAVRAAAVAVPAVASVVGRPRAVGGAARR